MLIPFKLVTARYLFDCLSRLWGGTDYWRDRPQPDRFWTICGGDWILCFNWQDGRNIWSKEVIQMNDKWKPTEEQNTGPISRVSEFFIDELNELQEELDCPDEFIYDFMEAIRNRWSPDSCHSQARKLKEDDADAY